MRTIALAVLALCAGSTFAQEEIVLQNDTLTAGGTAGVCPCFAADEQVAVWLTSPCDGSIVAFQIFWLSQFGGAQQTVEDSIIVYRGGDFPEPGLIKDVLLAPVMTDGGLNEFRFRDDNQVIPIDIPVAAGEEFVTALRFFNANANNFFAASVVTDANGCQAGKNAVYVDGSDWVDACQLGVSGDWVIRVVVECPTCPADFNGDGDLNNSDINLFINAFLDMNLAADLTGDGSLNNSDINAYVLAFIDGCD